MSERSIFLSALDIPDELARQAYLDEACAGDSRLRTEVEALLKSHTTAGSFLETPAVEQAAPVGPQTILLGNSGDTDDPLNSPVLGPVAVERDETEAAVLELLKSSEKPGSLGRLAHYEILELLGKGAFGVVLKAFDEKLHRMVAVKTMNPELAATSPPRKRFLREARSSAAVKHEHIVAIYAVEELPIPYLVMEYVPGLTLQQWLDQHGPLDVAEVLRIGQQIASGLAAAHAQGLIHRDIKPANILLETGIETRAKITDFGLARATDDASLTQSGLIAGTPMYMAPEQAKGQPLDHRADLFSLGSVLYTMVSGRPPFRAPNTIAVLKRVCEDTPRPIQEVIPEVPAWMCNIISKLHAKEPEDRFQTAKDVADLLGEHLAHLRQPALIPQPATVLRPVTPGKPTEEPSRTTALAALRGPARGLIATACLNWIGLIVLTLFAVGVAAAMGGSVAFGLAEMIVVPVLAIATTVILIGGLKMLRGESYGWCVTASVMAMLIGPGYFLGWPMGIWSLFVLSRPEVREHFRRRSVERSRFSALGDAPGSRSYRRAASFTAVLIVVGGLGLAQYLWSSRPGVVRLEFTDPSMTVTIDGPKWSWRSQPGKDAGFTSVPAGWYTWRAFLGDRLIHEANFTLKAGESLVLHVPAERLPSGTLTLPWVPRTGSFWHDAAREINSQAEWLPLFNGRDLTGWQPNDHWQIEDGCLVTRVPQDATKTPAMLVTNRTDFHDFHARIEAKINDRGDSGFFFRFGEQGDRALQAQITTTVGGVGRLLRDATTVVPTTRQISPETWFTLEVIARGPRIDVLVNGEPAVNWTDPSGEISAGPLAFESGFPGTEFMVRKVEIKPPADVDALSPLGVDTTRQPLFNNRDLAGWRFHPNEPGQWRVENGVLIGSGTPSCLFSERGDFTDFELHCEVSISQDGDGGALVRTPFELPDKDGLPGYETQIQSGRVLAAGWTTGAIGQSDPGTGWRMKQAAATSVTHDAFFPLVVKAVGNHIETYVNGSKVAEYDDPDRKYLHGHIALQQSGPNTQIRFRKIEIRELSSVPATGEASAPWIDLLKSSELARIVGASGFRQDGDALVSSDNSANRAAQAALESIRLKHAKMRLTAQAIKSMPQELIALGWSHGNGAPRRVDAVLQSFGNRRSYANLWQYGPQYELTSLVKSPAIAVDWTAPIVIECEIHDGTVSASIAGAPLQAVGGLDPMRPVMPYIGGTGSWRILEWKLQDLTPQVAIVPVDFNGAWDSGWGVVTFKHAPATGDQPFELEGEYTFHGKGVIQGTVDPLTRTFKGRFQETATQGGRLVLTLSPDGNSITGWYDYQSEAFDVSQPQLSWNMTRRPNPLDFSGDWDSRWGVVTLTHPAVNDLLPVTMTGRYYSGKGTIEGTADPRSRTFTGAFREATGMSGRINLQLSADSQHILGRYEYSNSPGTTYQWDMVRKNSLPDRPASAMTPSNAESNVRNR